MAPRPAPLLLLVLVAVGPRESCFGSRLHSLKYFYTSISDQCRGLPQFVVLGYVDDQVLVHYDSNSRKFQHRVSWMKEGDRKDPEYWNKYTEILQNNEKLFGKDLEKLKTRYNHSKSFHTWQRMVSCELQGNESKGGLWQYGYDGKTFITFDKKTLIWVATEHQAQVTKMKWNDVGGLNQYTKTYLEEECIEWLKKFLSYGNETLLRTEPPVVTMSSRAEVEDGMETHICRLDGFYPREIYASWTRDAEVWLQDTFHGSVAPNADGTYHYWLSIQIDPKERGRYRCHVEHDGLKEPLDLELKEPTDSKSKLWIIIGCCIGAALVLVCVIAGICLYRRCRNGYKTASRRNCEAESTDNDSVEGTGACPCPVIWGSDQRSNSSNQGSCQSMSYLLHRTENPDLATEQKQKYQEGNSQQVSLFCPSGQSQHEEREGNLVIRGGNLAPGPDMAESN